EGAPTLFVLRLEAHAGPDVGRHQVGAVAGLHRILELLDAPAEAAGAFGFDLVAGRRRDAHLEVEQLRGLQPAVADVVRVADPRHLLPGDRSAVLDVRVDVGEDLARVVFVGQPVDHRHARVRREALDDLLPDGADHHDVAPAPRPPRGGADG